MRWDEVQGPSKLDFEGLGWQAGFGNRVFSKEACCKGHWMAMGKDGDEHCFRR